MPHKFNLDRHETNVEEMLARYARRAEAVRPWIGPNDVVLDLGCGRQVFREVVRPAGYIGCDLLAHADNVVCDLDTVDDLSFAGAATVVVLLGVLVWLDDPARLLDVVARHRFLRVILSAPHDRIDGHVAQLARRGYQCGRTMTISGSPTHLVELRLARAEDGAGRGRG